MTTATLVRHSRAEMLKVTRGRAMLGLVLGGVLWCVLTSYGYYVDGVKIPLPPGSGAVTGQVVRAWMMLLLFSAIAGAMIVTRDFSQGTISRTVLALGGRREAFAAKLVATVLTSAGFAVVAVVGAGLSGLVALRSNAQLVWDSGCTQTLLGVAACMMLAGLWGLAVGWLVRNQTLSVLAIVIMVVGVEPAIQRLVPDVAQFLFTIALSSVYRDGKPDLLPVGAALGVCAVWIAGLGLAARTSFFRRDVG